MTALTGISGISSPLFTDGFPTSEAGPSKPPVYRVHTKPAPPAQVIDMFVKDASGPIRAIQPLRRGVSFTPRNDTKYFRSTDAIVPDKSLPPPSIRSYADLPSDDLEPPSLSLSDSIASSSPACLRSSSPTSRSSTPSGFRSILKPRKDVIRIAATVEEGTLNNKEPARLRVSGRRPKLLPRDSFQLAVLRRAASEGISLAAGGVRATSQGAQGGIRSGPGSDPEMPSSDDTAASDDRPVGSDASDAVPASGGGGSSDDEEEEEESIEEDGSLTTSSVVGIILDGAEDLLTLEEAYSTLSNRLRIVFTAKTGPLSPSVPTNHEASIRIAVQPLQDNASALVSALHRDLQRLLGKVPNSEIPPSEADSSPFRGLVPLQDSTPINRLGRSQPLTPSTGGKPSPESLRKGYTEAEVKYRREAAGVGAAALRFLAFVLHQPEVFRCFTEADLSSLLSTVMVIPRTPRLPTPNPKRTYYLSIFILGQLKVPAACVLPAKDKIVRAVEGAITETLGNMIASGVSGTGGSAKDSSSSLSSSQIRKEGFIALQNLLTTYPAIFFQHYADLLIPCLKALVPNNATIRPKAAQGVAAFASAKIQTVADAQSALMVEDSPVNRDAWAKARATARKCEMAVVAHFKSGLRVQGRMNTVVGKQGDRKTEASALEAVFKDVIGSNTEVAWACATWAMVVTLLGEQYPSCGLASGLDHIMNRSLQPSQNGTRPLFARTAWHHAVHAYFTAGTTTSFDKDGKLVQSFTPYPVRPSSDASQQIAMLQFPVDLALEAANTPTAVVRVLTTPGGFTEGEPLRSMWMRIEKAKRRSWLETCGIGAATIVYAYSTMALGHQEQPIPQAASALEPSAARESPIPDSLPVDSKLERLDQAWSKVVRPMISSLLEVRGIDRLKLHGWQILGAMTSLKPATAAPTLDRLLSTRFLAGEAFTLEKEAGLVAFMTDLEADAIKAGEVPSWGADWMLQRFDPLLDMFMEALIGVPGLEGVQSVKWISLPSGEITLPIGLSRIWCNLLRVLATIKSDSAQVDVYADGLKSIACLLIKILNLDPASYLPISMYGREDRCFQDVDSTRVRLVYHLVDAMYQILGREAFHAVRLDFTAKHSEETESIESTLARTSFGSDAQGKPTLSGALLGSLLRTKVFVSPMPRLLKQLVVKVFAAGLAPGVTGKMLGDMTNCLPWLFEADEEMQLEVWRLLATSWPDAIDLQPSAVPNTSGTNHTGALLVTLLAHPFRGRDLGSFWYQHDSEADLRVWTKLLSATVYRFRAKRVGANQGVLDALTEQLGDSLQSPKTSSSTIALSCLAAAMNWLTFSPETAADDSVPALDETHVPAKFLTLVSSALLDSYPSQESLVQGSASFQPASPAVGGVISAIKSAISKTQANASVEVIEAVRPGLVRWLSDEAKMAEFELAEKLDDLYVVLLESLSGAIGAGHLPATSGTLDRYIEIFAPRLSLAVSADVPRAFQAFWTSSFATAVRAEDLSEDVAAFLQEVVDAVPGLITVNGLAVQASISEEESQAKFPGALSLASQPEPANEQHIEDVPVAEDAAATTVSEEPEASAAATEQAEQPELDIATQMPPAPTADYDADDSLRTHEDQTTLTAANEAEVEPSSEVDVPFASSVADDEEVPGLQRLEFRPSKRPTEAVEDVDGEKDVFGATCTVSAAAAAAASTVAGPGRKGKRKARRPASANIAKRTKSDTALLDMETLVPESPAVAPAAATGTTERNSSGEQEQPTSAITDVSSADSRTSLQPQRSLFNVAGKWLAKVPSFSGLPFFSPHHRPEDESTPVVRKIQVHDPAVPHDGLPATPIDEPASEASTEQSVSSPRSEQSSQAESPDSDDMPSRSRRPRKSSKRKADADEVAPAKSSRASKRKKAKADNPAGRGRRTRSRSSYARSGGSIEQPIELTDDDDDDDDRDDEIDMAEEADAGDVKVDIDADEDDEDDVLLLSPESAEKSRGEEEGAIAAARQSRAKAAAVAESAMPSSSPASATRAARRRAAAVSRQIPAQSSRRYNRANDHDEDEDEPVQSGSMGRFDDAPDDTLRPPSSPSPPPRTKPQPLVPSSIPAQRTAPTTGGKSASTSASASGSTGSSSPSGSGSPAEARTAQQARVLYMLEEAARAREAVEQLDLEGITSLLRHINELRDAATKNLELRARKSKSRRA